MSRLSATPFPKNPGVRAPDPRPEPKCRAPSPAQCTPGPGEKGGRVLPAPTRFASRCGRSGRMRRWGLVPPPHAGKRRGADAGGRSLRGLKAVPRPAVGGRQGDSPIAFSSSRGCRMGVTAACPPLSPVLCGHHGPVVTARA